MITTFEGPMGNGKTLTATTLAYLEMTSNGKKVIANYKLKFKYTHFDPIYFLQHLGDEEMTNCVMILDEAYLIGDSRVSGGKLNRLFTYFIAQTRKREVDLYVCTQHIDVLDKRLRRAADVRGTCTYEKEKPCRGCEGTKEVPLTKGICIDCGGSGQVLDSSCKEGQVCCPTCGGSKRGIVCPRCLGNGETGWATTQFVDYRRRRRFGEKRIKTIRIFAPAFWDLYDTNERVPFMAKQLKVPLEDLQYSGS